MIELRHHIVIILGPDPNSRPGAQDLLADVHSTSLFIPGWWARTVLGHGIEQSATQVRRYTGELTVWHATNNGERAPTPLEAQLCDAAEHYRRRRRIQMRENIDNEP